MTKHFAKVMISDFDRVENIVGIREEHFAPFPTMFSILESSSLGSCGKELSNKYLW